ncbi:MAG: pyridoxamine 5'-phosphate oxidase family protein [Erysipelotrichaceae bacterium]|jgi:hypothetical protein|nr:pyridoxamine 5'-phosphate oxidase family protein [Erysipelotrichaceae bacterium]
MLPEKVKTALANSKLWVLATSGDTPNAVMNLFHEIDENDHLVFYQVFLNKTVENIKNGSSAAVVAHPQEGMEAYQIKGKAYYSTAQKLVDRGKQLTARHHMPCKGAVVVEPEVCYILTPGPDNGKIL